MDCHQNKDGERKPCDWHCPCKSLEIAKPKKAVSVPSSKEVNVKVDVGQQKQGQKR
jgi:hypothetical protein